MVTDHEEFAEYTPSIRQAGKMGIGNPRAGLHIHYCPGKVNQTADALSPLPMPISPGSREHTVSGGSLKPPVVQAKDGEATVNQVGGTSNNATPSLVDSVAEDQDADPDLKALKLYLLQEDFPEDQKKAREFVWEGRSLKSLIESSIMWRETRHCELFPQ